MKKLFTSIVCAALAVVSFDVAASTTYSDARYSYNNGVFTFKSDYTCADFARRVDGKSQAKLSNGQTVSVNVENISKFGFYKIAANGASNSTADFITLYDKAAGENNSVIFNKNEKVGVFMEITTTTTERVYVKDSWFTGHYETKTTTTTKTYTTTNVKGADATVANFVDPDSSAATGQFFCFFTTGRVDGNTGHYEYYMDELIASEQGQSYDDFISKVIEELGGEGKNFSIVDSQGNEVTIADSTTPTPGANGQPLPGLLTTLVLGGAALVGGKKLKNRKNSSK